MNMYDQQNIFVMEIYGNRMKSVKFVLCKSQLTGANVKPVFMGNKVSVLVHFSRT